MAWTPRNGGKGVWNYDNKYGSLKSYFAHINLLTNGYSPRIVGSENSYTTFNNKGFMFSNFVNGGSQYEVLVTMPSRAWYNSGGYKLTVVGSLQGQIYQTLSGTNADTFGTVTADSGTMTTLSNTTSVITFDGEDFTLDIPITTVSPLDTFTYWTFVIQGIDELNPPTEIALYRADHATNYANGETFNPDFIAGLNRLNFGCLRPLGAFFTNQKGYPTPDMNRIINNDCFSPEVLNGGVPEANYFYADVATDTGTDTYEMANYPSAPTTFSGGERFICRFDSTNTNADPTLKVGTNSARTIRGADVGSGVGLSQQVTSGTLKTTTNYCAAVDQYTGEIMLIQENSFFNVGEPLSNLVELCNTVGCNLWLTLNHLLTPAEMRTLIDYVRDNLDSDLYCFYELSNESWNSGTDFSQTYYHTTQVGVRHLGIPTGSNRALHGGYAYQYLDMVEQVEASYAVTAATNYVRVIGVQTGIGAGSVTEHEDYRLKGNDLGVTSPNRPIDHCDAIATAPYFELYGFKQYDTTQSGAYDSAGVMTTLVGLCDDYDAGGPRKQAALRKIHESSNAAYYYNTAMSLWNTVANTYGVKCIQYEGGQSGIHPSKPTWLARGYSDANATTEAGRSQTLWVAFRESRWAGVSMKKMLVNSTAYATTEWPANLGIQSTDSTTAGGDNLNSWGLTRGGYNRGIEQGGTLWQNGEAWAEYNQPAGTGNFKVV